MSFKSIFGVMSRISFIFVFILLSSCNSSELEYTIETTVNPHKIAPLTALLNITSEKPCSISVKVLGESPIAQAFDNVSTNLSIPVVGLYANTLNKVVVSLHHDGGTVNDTITIQTKALPQVFPTIQINKIDRNAMEDGLHACDIHFANNGKFNSMPLIFDDQGQVRWYLDLSFHGKMVSPFQRLKDGTLLMVGRHTVYQFDMLGKRLKTSEISKNYGMHHDVLELPNGQLLICVGKRDQYIQLNGKKVMSDSDFIMLYDRKTNTILKEWDLAKHLDVDRNDLNFFRGGDWLHMNGLAFNPKDSTIIVSARNQGLINISWNDELKWIMAPRQNWHRSGRDGNGFETRPYILRAINENGLVLYKDVQDGITSTEDFDLPWGPHAPKILDNGHILVFDNGPFRNYNNENNYSRAVEYKVSERYKTVEQIWQYGKERGTDLFSSIVSDVDYLPNQKNILMTSGFLSPTTRHAAKIVEIDYATRKPVFEATLFLKDLVKNGKGWGQSDILYRSERMILEY